MRTQEVRNTKNSLTQLMRQLSCSTMNHKYLVLYGTGICFYKLKAIEFATCCFGKVCKKPLLILPCLHSNILMV